MTAPTLAAQRDQFAAEFAAIESSIVHACTELGKLMASYRLNAGALHSAQDHALASTVALRRVVESITPGRARPVSPTRPQDCTASLADQLADHRAGVAQTLALVQHMPGVPGAMVSEQSSEIARRLHTLEHLARTHQPTKARQ